MNILRGIGTVFGHAWNKLLLLFQYSESIPQPTKGELNCKKKIDHDKFILARSFSIKDLPEGYRDGDLARLISWMAQLTGLIKVKSRKGTGFIQRIRRERGQCPCHECKEGCRKNVFAIFTVTTAVHVFSEKVVVNEHMQFKINARPEHITFMLNYDFNNNGVNTIYGWNILETDKDINEKMDWCCIDFVTHDLKLAQKLEKDLTEYQKMQAMVYTKFKDQDVDLVVVVGHPHGGIKKISLGKKSKDPLKILKVIRDTQKWGRYKYTTPTCPGNSGSPVLILGQPISGFGYWFGHPHNHAKFSKKEQLNISSIGADHI